MTKSILVIDDEEAIRKSFVLALEDSGYTVDAAESGERGIELHKEKPYGAIFLDLKMPGIDGIQVLRRMREKDKRVPIYIITAFHEEFFKELKAIEAEGINFELLRKPVESAQIIQAVTSIIERSNA